MNSKPVVTTTASGLVWVERFSCHIAQVGRVGSMEIAWDHGGYRVTVFGSRLKQPSPSVEDAKRRAISLAKQLLAEAATALAAE